MLKSASGSRARSATVAPSGATTLIVIAQAFDQFRHFDDVVAVAEAERSGPEDVAGLARRARRRRTGRGRCEGAHQPVEGLRRAPVFLLLVGRQFERHHRNVESERRGQAAGIVLDEFGRAGRADQHRIGLEALDRVAAGGLEDLRRVGAEVARLEGRVGDRRARVAPLDHGEQQVGIGVALRRVQHVVDALHRSGDPHRADMGRAFICPDGELHQALTFSRSRRLKGRANSSARSPACS